MTDYKNMTPEQEAGLVPSWIGHFSESSVENSWYYKADPDTDSRRILSLRGDEIQLGFEFLNRRIVRDLLPALQFFAATGRLPRRLDAGGGV